METPSIQSSASLLDLTISVYTGRRTDRQTASEITIAKNASSNATSVQKYLFAGDKDLRRIQSLSSAVRSDIAAITLPWNDHGVRLVPTKVFFDVVKILDRYKQEFDTLVQDFLSNYEIKIKEAAKSLGDMFNPDDYLLPIQVGRRFNFHYEFQPVPSAGDFRIDLPNEAMQMVTSRYQESVDNKVSAATFDLSRRLIDLAKAMRDRCTATKNGTKPRLYEATLDSAKELCQIAKGLNMFNDPEIEALRQELEGALGGLDIHTLRESEDVREDVRSKMESILSKFN